MLTENGVGRPCSECPQTTNSNTVQNSNFDDYGDGNSPGSDSFGGGEPKTNSNSINNEGDGAKTKSASVPNSNNDGIQDQMASFTQPSHRANIVEEIFMKYSDTKIHNYNLCGTLCHLTDNDTLTYKKGQKAKKFQHGWIRMQNMSYDKVTGIWWLVYVENLGMFCVLCKKHQSSSNAWTSIPCVKLVTDAILDHSNSKKHKECVEREMLQRVSTFQKQIDRKVEFGEEIIAKGVRALYWILKQEIPTVKVVSLLDLIEKLGISDLNLFQHRSEPSIRELALTIGEVLLNNLLQNVGERPFGLLVDEVSDIAIKEQMMIFIKYVQESGIATTQFLSCVSIDNPSGPNAENLTEAIIKEIKDKDLSEMKIGSFVSDGASVMTGRLNGVAARLKRLNPPMLSFHCICHKLALACNDTSDCIQAVKQVEETLFHVWNFFENSPKRTNALVNTQILVKEMSVSDKEKKVASKKLQKACKTRWLSIEASVSSALQNIIPVLLTLKALDTNPTALGLYKKMRSSKFMYVLYVLNIILPILSWLSRTFQTGALNFSCIMPAIVSCKNQIEQVQDPIQQVKEDIQTSGKLANLEITMSKYEETHLSQMFQNYKESIITNIDDRFQECLGILENFKIFDPINIPEDELNFRNYGLNEITKIGEHFYKHLEIKMRDAATDKLKVEWPNFKHILKKMKPKVPEEVKEAYQEPKKKKKESEQISVTSLEWLLTEILKEKPTYTYFYPEILKIIEVVHSAPLTNAWPERGASALKRIKTRMRSRLKNDILNTLLMISINGPDAKSKQCEELCNEVAKKWKKKKDRRKIPVAPKKHVQVNEIALDSETDYNNNKVSESLLSSFGLSNQQDSDSDDNVSSSSDEELI